MCLGAAMSYFAWAARSTISATSFTIVGNMVRCRPLPVHAVPCVRDQAWPGGRLTAEPPARAPQCKILTIVINVLLWDKHASAFGIVCLLGCLAAAFVYKQAPLRGDKNIPK